MNWENKASILTTADQVEATVGRPAPIIMRKQISALDAGCRTILARSPIAAFGYRDAGVSRTTFVGGTPGFIRVHSLGRFSFVLPGSGDPRGPVSFFFLLPGVGELLRINGSVAGRTGAETVVDVQEAYVHCAQAVLRSRLWQPREAAVREAAEPRAGSVAEFLAASPFLALSTWDSAGGSDTSPRGDRQAVARFLDDRTLVIPDRRGNRRADTLHNLLTDDRLSFAALVPGRGGVLHVRGRGAITDDPALLETMALRGVPPHAALLIDVEHAEVTGNDAVARSRMWTPGAHLTGATAPDLMALAGDHLAANSPKAQGRLLRLVGAIPGLTRLLRLAVDRAYRSGLREEGYEDVPAASHRREVRIVEVRRETPSAVTLVLADGEPFDFRPGQFFTLVADIGGRPVRRAYSASSAPGSSRLEVTVKRVGAGRFSTHVHRALKKGDRLAVLGPSGSFHAEAQPPDEIVLIAAGSGMTPMMSMIRARLAVAEGRDRITLHCSSRSESEILFAGELARLATDNPDRLSVTHVLTARDGRLDEDGVRRWIAARSPATDAHYYVCGPEPLMDAVDKALTRLGVPAARRHSERYASGADSGTPTTEPQEMTVEEDGRPIGTVVVDPGRTLLDAGLAAGLPMPYSCTVGNCGDCVVRLRDGKVTQNEPNCLTPVQRSGGYVLACQSCPLSKVTVDIVEP